MHLIVPFAASSALLERVPPGSMATPQLETLLRDWAEVRRDTGDSASLSPPHERAWARALGLDSADGCLPWAALQAAADGITVSNRTWALLTPVHWRIGNDGVHLANPALLDLSDADSRALFDAVRQLFESEGYATAWGAPLRWYVAHHSLHGLACASLDRVIGRNVDAWLPPQAAARPLRRLQNEAQMTLHGHPVNDARDAANQLAVNSVWVSACGAAQATNEGDARLDDRLRAPALSEDTSAWLSAWQALDHQALGPLVGAAARDEPARLTLCGERSAVELAPRRRGWWQRVTESVAPARPRARSLLESL